MATIKAIVRPLRVSRKTGLCKVELSISHQGKRVYVDTGIQCLPENFVNGALTKKVPNHIVLNSKITNLLAEYDKRLSKISVQQFYDTKTLVSLVSLEEVKTQRISYTYSSLCAKAQNKCIEEGRENYAKLLERSRKVFMDFLGERCISDIAIQDITPFLISSWQEWMLKKRGLSTSTTGMYLAEVKAILNSAIKEGIVVYEKHPFADVKIGRSTVRNCDIDIHELAKFRDADNLTKGESKVRDIWMLSFYLGGMNLKDMLSVCYDLEKKSVSYQRSKTKDRNPETIIVPLCHEARKLIAEYKDDENKLNIGYNGKHETILRTIDHRLKDIAKKLNISNTICFYSARKTFAQLASEAGINTEMIDYLLGHANNSKGVIRHYVHQDFGLCAVAIRTIMDYVENPQKNKTNIAKVLKRL